jgi:membrane glycosyltransferase
VAIWDSTRGHNYFPGTHALFPDWPVWHWGWGITLLISTATVLFLPKLLCLIYWLFKHGNSPLYGSAIKLSAGVLLETVLSTLLAPVRMLFHSKFVLLTLLGQKIGWEAQTREDRGITWGTAFKIHGWGMLTALAIGLGVFFFSRSFIWWLLPVFFSLVLAPATSVLTSRSSIGRFFRRIGLFVIPEEVQPPPELDQLNELLKRKPERAMFESLNGFARAVVDPSVHALHLSMLRRERKLSQMVASRRENLALRVLEKGPLAATAAEKKELLSDPVCLSKLHRDVWKLDQDRARDWGVVVENG